MTSTSPHSDPFPSLRLPHAEADEKIASQTDAGQGLLRTLDDPKHRQSEVGTEHKR